MSKFIRRLWSLFIDRSGTVILNDVSGAEEEFKILHKTIKKISEDIQALSFNTAISAMMIFVNEMKRLDCHKKDVLLPMIRLIAPFAPFIAEEIWHLTGHSGSVHLQQFPVYDKKYLEESTIEYPVCINGKKRGLEIFQRAMSNADIENQVLALDYVNKWIEGKIVQKIIVIPGRMINIVVK